MGGVKCSSPLLKKKVVEGNEYLNITKSHSNIRTRYIKLI